MSSCKVVSEAEVSALKDTLCAQQKLLQQLYSELEAEREASATAASEALSVILRLQREKAAVKMEAEQYKRLAEERMGYAEESFAMIEDMITEKEMEVAELDYQVQTYRYQLMSMGVDVPPGNDDTNIPENLLQRNEGLPREGSLHHFKGKKAMLESNTSIDLELISKSVEEQMGQEVNEFISDSERKADVSTNEGISCFAGQIKELQQRVQEITGANLPGFMSASQSPSRIQPETKLPSQGSISTSYDPAKLGMVDEIGDIDKSEAAHSPHDVFEVPQVDEEYESRNKDRQKAVFEASDILESQDKSQLEAVKDEPDSLKKLLRSDLCKPSDIAAVQSTSSVDVTLMQSTSSVKRSREMSEVERPAESSNREEELKLLKEIKEKLNDLQVEIKFQKVDKSLARDEPSLQPLAEVMISFWL